MRVGLPGTDDLSNERLVPETKVVSYTYEDLDGGNALRIPIEAGKIVLNVTHIVTTLFSGGSPSLDIGDASQASGWLASSDITEGTEGNIAQSRVTSNAYKHGKVFLTAGFILLQHAASLAAGAGTVLIEYVTLAGDWRHSDL